MKDSRQHTLIRYLAYAKPYKWIILLMVLTGIAKFTLPMVPAKITRIIMDEVLTDSSRGMDQRKAYQLKLGLAMVGSAILIAIVTFIRGYTHVVIDAAIAFDWRQDLWRHLQRLSLGFHNTRPTGSLLSRLINDINVAQGMLNGGIVNVIIDAAAGTAALAQLLLLNVPLTLLVIVVLPIYGALYRKVNPQIRKVSHKVQEQTAVISGTAVERLNGIAVVQSFAQEPAEERLFASQADELRDLSVRRGRLDNILQATSHFLMDLAVVTVWVVGGWMVIAGGWTISGKTLGGDMTPGKLMQFIGVTTLLYTPIRRFSEINIVYQTSMAAIERVFAIFDVIPEVLQRPGVVDRQVGLGGVQFDQVRFRYSTDAPLVLNDLRFTVRPGERVAIVGESGAGKSTLVTLIPRLYDVSDGAIRIDGVDIRDYPLRRLRRSIGIVLQDTILFSGSVRENIRYGRKKAGEDEIVAAAKAATAHEFIEALPDGYDTMIGERGMTLSGGQRQRISLARTILQAPRILILDEATSNLDSESENLIVDALERLMVGRTSLIIAHRLSTVIGADRILVLKEGRLVEEGPHADLLAAGGYYRYLFEQQFGPLQQMLAKSSDQAT